MRIIIEKNKNVQLIIGGIKNSYYESYLNPLVEQYQLSEYCDFIGYVNDTSSFFKNLDIYVMPSLSEGFPQSPLEAMSFGLPVVASNVGGLKEQINHGINGLLVEPSDPVQLADALIHFIRSKEKRVSFGNRSQEIIKNKFNIENMVLDLKKHYLSIEKPSINHDQNIKNTI